MSECIYIALYAFFHIIDFYRGLTYFEMFCAHWEWNWNFVKLIDKFKMVLVLTHSAFYTDNGTGTWGEIVDSHHICLLVIKKKLWTPGTSKYELLYYPLTKFVDVSYRSTDLSNVFVTVTSNSLKDMVIENMNDVYENVITDGKPCSCHYVGLLKMCGIYFPFKEVDMQSTDIHSM